MSGADADDRTPVEPARGFENSQLDGSKNRGVEFRDFAHPLQASGVVPFYASQKNTVPLRNDSFLCRMRRVRSGCNLKKHKHHHSKRTSSHPRKVGDFHRHDSSQMAIGTLYSSFFSVAMYQWRRRATTTKTKPKPFPAKLFLANLDFERTPHLVAGKTIPKNWKKYGIINFRKVLKLVNKQGRAFFASLLSLPSFRNLLLLLPPRYPSAPN